MATSQRIYDLSLQAAVDLYTTSKQFFIMKIDSDGRAAVAGAADAAMMGVLQNKPKQYEAANIRQLGITKVICGDTITCGAKVTSDGAGEAVAAAATNKYVGTAMETGADGRIISVLLEHGYMPAS
jgi:hypothetical protein